MVCAIYIVFFHFRIKRCMTYIYIYIYLKAKPWAGTVMVKLRGTTSTEQRPTSDVCMACYSWFLKHLGRMMSWPTFRDKLKHDRAWKGLIALARKVSKGEADRAFDPSSVFADVEFGTGIKRCAMGLSLSELKTASRRTYIPKSLLMGPHMFAPREHGEGFERIWFFKLLGCEYRIVEELTRSGSHRQTSLLDASDHVYEPQAETLMDDARNKRHQALNLKGNLVQRTVAIPSLSDWLAKADPQEEDHGEEAAVPGNAIWEGLAEAIDEAVVDELVVAASPIDRKGAVASSPLKDTVLYLDGPGPPVLNAKTLASIPTMTPRKRIKGKGLHAPTVVHPVSPPAVAATEIEADDSASQIGAMSRN